MQFEAELAQLHICLLIEESKLVHASDWLNLTWSIERDYHWVSMVTTIESALGNHSFSFNSAA